MMDGHLNKCKICTKKDVKKHKAKNAEYYKQYESERAKLPHRVAARLRYQKTAKGAESTLKAKKKWQRNNPEKRAAHLLLQYAIRRKEISKKPCEICGNVKAHGHHEDYSKPLEVIWLCSKHHAEHHRK
jgi:hypothetical protein